MEEQLARMTHRELMALVERQEAMLLALQAETGSLCAAVRVLRAENEALR